MEDPLTEGVINNKTRQTVNTATGGNLSNHNATCTHSMGEYFLLYRRSRIYVDLDIMGLFEVKLLCRRWFLMGKKLLSVYMYRILIILFNDCF